MESSTPSDVFFTLGSIVLVIFIVLLIIFSIYLIRVIRAIQGVRGAITKSKLAGLAIKVGSGTIGKGVIATSIVRWIISVFNRRRGK